MLMGSWTLRRAYLVAIVLGLLISLIIELLQAHLPTRDSSQTDLICNTLGAILGVVVFHYAEKKGIHSLKISNGGMFRA